MITVSRVRLITPGYYQDTRSLSLCSYKIKCSIYQNILYLFIKSLHSIVDLFILLNLMYAIRNNLDGLLFYIRLKMIKTQR